MSASRQKKLRQEQAASAPTTKRRAVTEEEKAAKRLKIWSAVFYVIIGLMVIGIAVAAIANTGVLERTLTAVTIGNHKLTAAELNYYYLDTVNNTMSSNSMMSYMVTSGTPLDEQEYLGEGFDTWADYFLDTAITTARNTYAIYDEAVAKGLHSERRGTVSGGHGAVQHVCLRQHLWLQQRLRHAPGQLRPRLQRVQLPGVPGGTAAGQQLRQ
ncbi:MAG: hypothetical protein ACLSHU_10500 [Oscillospiraceae bacterium]